MKKLITAKLRSEITDVEDNSSIISRCLVLHFKNGYAASIIKNIRGQFEVAVINPEGQMDYTTPITKDVVSHLTQFEAQSVAFDIAMLK